MFYKHGLEPPADIVEAASFLVTLSFLRQHQRVAFVAHDVARYLEVEQLARTLALRVPIELPPVGLIMLCGGLRTPAADKLMGLLRACARRGAKGRRRPVS